MICPNCGNEVTDNMKFCPTCGSSLEMFENPIMPVMNTPPAPKEDNLKGYGKYDYKRSHADKDKKTSKFYVRSSASVIIVILLFILMLIPFIAGKTSIGFLFSIPFIISLRYCFTPPKVRPTKNDTFSNTSKTEFAETDDLQTQLARKELADNPFDGSKADGICSFIFFCVGIIIYFYPNKSSSLFLWSFLLVPLCFILSIVFWYTSRMVKRHREQLEHLAKGEKIVNVCPKCKSENIVMNMVQTDSYTTHGVTRISDNMNPLHPFTHTNVRKGADHTTNSFGSQCHCKNCGHVFSQPEVHYV